MPFEILLVDDEPDFLVILGDYLREKGFNVIAVPDGHTALNTLSHKEPDLIISDIQMPGMKGFELLSRAAEKYPNLKKILITAYDIRDYIHNVYTYDIGTILVKDIPLNYEEIHRVITLILSEEIFGLENLFKAPIWSETISAPMDIEMVMEQVIDSFSDERNRRSFRMSLRETITNAVFYGAKHECPRNKKRWDVKTPLLSGKEVMVSWSQDEEKAGVSVLDQSGLLTKKDVLYWLSRNIERNENGFAIGKDDTHGRGLFIARESTDRFIVNIDRGKKTEIVLLNYRSRNLQAVNRPLWIQEI